jgi:hypothetical protein
MFLEHIPLYPHTFELKRLLEDADASTVYALLWKYERMAVV